MLLLLLIIIIMIIMIIMILLLLVVVVIMIMIIVIVLMTSRKTEGPAGTIAGEQPGELANIIVFVCCVSASRWGST